MAKRTTILVLTSGGLAPALNATLYGVITKARKYHYRIFGGICGWASLVQHGKIIDLTKLNIESIKNRGGTFLRSSRTNPFKVQGGINLLKEKLNDYKIDALIAIGGDDTLSAAAKLYWEERIPIIGLPKTIDNDLPCTYFSPGFPSAAYFAAKLTAETKEDSAYALSRVFIIEMYGAEAGWLTCAAALGGADIIIPPEWQFDLTTILNLIKKRYEKNGNYCLISLSKEANINGLKKEVKDKQPDGFNHRRNEFVSLALRDKIQSILGLSTKIIIPMNYFQSGNPIKLDQEISYKLGALGVKFIERGKFGQALTVQYSKKKIYLKGMPLLKFSNQIRQMDSTFFNKKTMQPTLKYLKYLKTLLNCRNFTDNNYLRLQKIICNKQ